MVNAGWVGLPLTHVPHIILIPLSHAILLTHTPHLFFKFTFYTTPIHKHFNVYYINTNKVYIYLCFIYLQRVKFNICRF